MRFIHHVLEYLAALLWPRWVKPDSSRFWEAWFEYRLEQLERREMWLFRLFLLHILIDAVIYLWLR